MIVNTDAKNEADDQFAMAYRKKSIHQESFEAEYWKE